MTTAVKVITIQRAGRAGDRRYVIFDLSITTYATGGASLSAADLGLSGEIYVMPEIATGGALQPNVFTYNYTTGKVMAWKYPDVQAVEVGDATNAGKAYRMIAYGSGT
jgi:hypothetical protein